MFSAWIADAVAVCCLIRALETAAAALATSLESCFISSPPTFFMASLAVVPNSLPSCLPALLPMPLRESVNFLAPWLPEPDISWLTDFLNPVMTGNTRTAPVPTILAMVTPSPMLFRRW